MRVSRHSTQRSHGCTRKLVAARNRSSSTDARKMQSPPSVYSCCSVSSAPADDSTYANHLTWSQQRERKLQAARERQAAEEAAALLATPGMSAESRRLVERTVYAGPVSGWEAHEALHQAHKAPRAPEAFESFAPQINAYSAALERPGAAWERLHALATPREVAVDLPRRAKTPPPVDGPTIGERSEEFLQRREERRQQEQRAAQPTFSPALDARSRALAARGRRDPARPTTAARRAKAGAAGAAAGGGGGATACLPAATWAAGQCGRDTMEALLAAEASARSPLPAGMVDFLDRSERSRRAYVARREAGQMARRDSEVVECTFQPKVNRRKTASARVDSGGRRGGSSGGSPSTLGGEARGALESHITLLQEALDGGLLRDPLAPPTAGDAAADDDAARALSPQQQLTLLEGLIAGLPAAAATRSPASRRASPPPMAPSAAAAAEAAAAAFDLGDAEALRRLASLAPLEPPPPARTDADYDDLVSSVVHAAWEHAQHEFATRQAARVVAATAPDAAPPAAAHDAAAAAPPSRGSPESVEPPRRPPARAAPPRRPRPPSGSYAAIARHRAQT